MAARERRQGSVEYYGGIMPITDRQETALNTMASPTAMVYQHWACVSPSKSYSALTIIRTRLILGE